MLQGTRGKIPASELNRNLTLRLPALVHTLLVPYTFRTANKPKHPLDET